MIAFRIKFRHLQCFLEIARQRSVTKAAHALGLAQPTVSRTLIELEGILGCKLVERGRDGLVVTESGREFHRFAGISISALRSGTESIRKQRDPTSMLVRAGCLPNIAAHLMPSAVVAFRSEFSTARLYLISEPVAMLMPQLLHGEIEMIIGRMPESDQLTNLSFQPLYRERQVFLVRPRHPLVTKKRFAIERLIQYPFIMQRAHSSIRQDIDRFVTSLGLPTIKPAIIINNNADFARNFVAKSDAIWCAPKGLVVGDIARKALVVLPIDTSSLQSTIGITVRTDLPPTSLAQAFAETVRRISADLPND